MQGGEAVNLQYTYTNNVTNWVEANNQCLQLTGGLPITTSKEELDYMANHMKMNNITTAWLGLRKHTFAELHWLDGSNVCE